MLAANELKNNTIFLFQNQPHKVLKYQHTHLGRKGANVRVKIKNLKTGAILSQNFGGKDKFEEVWLDKRKLKYLKDVGSAYLFFNPDEKQNLEVEKKAIGEDGQYLVSEKEYDFLFYEEEPLSLELPPSMVMKIAECDPGVKGDSATNLYKRAVAKNGLELKVPLFVNIGDKVRIDTRTGEYIERA
jgi:elongation factor P